MARFRYQAKALDGRSVSGEIEAADETDAKFKVRGLQLIPIKVTIATGPAAVKTNKSNISMADALFGKKISSKELQVFIRQFATLINAGITVVDALAIISGGSSAPELKKALAKIKTSIESGRGLADSMAVHPLIFDSLFCNMVRAGESSGQLDQILLRLAVYIEKSEKIKGQIKGAFIYPIAIIIVAVAVIAGILIFVFPKFQELYKNSGQEPPAMTQFVVDMSDFLTTNWYLVLAFFVSTPAVIMAYGSTTEGKKNIDENTITIPVVGDLILKSSIARFSRTLSTLLSSGLPLIEAIDISAKTSGNYVIEKTLQRCKESVIVGKSFASPLAQQKVIPKMVTQMVAIGEQTGAVDNMLAKVADFYEDEVDNAVKAVTALIEPVLMVVLGGIIAFLVIAMYLPIFNMADTVGR